MNSTVTRSVIERWVNTGGEVKKPNIDYPDNVVHNSRSAGIKLARMLFRADQTEEEAMNELVDMLTVLAQEAFAETDGDYGPRIEYDELRDWGSQIGSGTAKHILVGKALSGFGYDYISAQRNAEPKEIKATLMLIGNFARIELENQYECIYYDHAT
jgi:hypothetical protein